MGRFLIFLLFLIVLAMAASIVALVWCKLIIVIKRHFSLFDIEKETHEKIKEKLQEDEN